MPDYAALLDAEVQAFLQRCDAFYPPDAVDLSVAEQRQVYDAMCAAFDYGHPKGVQSEDRAFGRVPCRVYESGAASGTVVYYHGGGFVVGGLDSHDSICAEFCAGTGLRVVAVDYRLSPEHPHPEDYGDALAAFEAVRAAFDGPLVLAGDSAGGNLAAAVAHAKRSEARLKGVLLIYPGLGGALDLPSYVEHAEAPGLTVRDIAFYGDMRTGGLDKTGDPTIYPLQDTDFAGLPKTVIITAECDPLSSDGKAYAACLSAAGVPALWREEAGLVHGYLRARRMSAKAGASFERMVQSLTALSGGVLPDF